MSEQEKQEELTPEQIRELLQRVDRLELIVATLLKLAPPQEWVEEKEDKDEPSV